MPSPCTVAVTDTGLVRERNEDSAYVGRWLCAADPGRLTAVLGSAVNAANRQLAAKAAADPGLAGMGSTLTAMLWSGTHLAIGHIGDSRAYRLRNQALAQITEDHVVSNLVAAPMPARIGEHLVRFLDARPGWSPDLTLRPVLPGDRYLICSDGLSSFVGPDAIRDALAGRGDLAHAADDLIQLAYAAGAPDNVTLIAVDIPDGTWQERGGSPLVLGAAVGVAGAP